jgi:hypothetical protein
MSRIIHLERFVGKPVHDATGKNIGHLHEVRAKREGKDLVVVEYVVGRRGLLERFSLANLGRQIGLIFGLGRTRSYVVPWQRMDFSDAKGPRCTCAADELEQA